MCVIPLFHYPSQFFDPGVEGIHLFRAPLSLKTGYLPLQLLDGKVLVVDDLLLLERVMIQLVDPAGEITASSTPSLDLSLAVFLC